MRTFNWVVWFVCTIIFIFLGALLLVFSAHLKGWINIEFFFMYLKNQPDLWLISVQVQADREFWLTFFLRH